MVEAIGVNQTYRTSMVVYLASEGRLNSPIDWSSWDQVIYIYIFIYISVVEELIRKQSFGCFLACRRNKEVRYF
jgi:hypothetical protein